MKPLKNRAEGDSRRTVFKRQIDYMQNLGEEWEKLTAIEHQKELKTDPFDDHAEERNSYCRDLYNSGMSYRKAWKKAFEKFPAGKYKMKIVLK